MPSNSVAPNLPEASPYSRHIPALDGLRGLAILLVMGSHFFPGTPHNLPERITRDALSFGATGVDLFFVLSGFLITGILYDSLQDPRFFQKFYARRALRILPLYYAVLAVYATVGLVQHLSSHGELLSLALYLQNTNLISPAISFYNGPLALPLGHFWSLAIEEQFYLVWPLLVYSLRTRLRLLVLCAIVILFCPVLRVFPSAVGVSPQMVHISTLFRADSLVFGGALALLLRSRWHDRTLLVAGWFALAIPAWLVISRFIVSASSHTAAVVGSIHYSVLALGYIGLLALALASTACRAFFSLGPMRSLGKYSYGLYVLHLILLGYIEQPLRHWLAQNQVSKGLSVALVGLIGFSASFCAAVLSYRLYERHFLKLKRFFEYRPRGSAADTGKTTPTSPRAPDVPAAALH